MLRNWYQKHARQALRQSSVWIVGIGLVWCAALLLRRSGIAANIDNGLSALGFDEERIRLLDALILTLLCSLLAGLLLRHRASTWLGGMTYFSLHYLLPFIQQAQNPGPGPDGQSQLLLPGALSNVLLTLIGLALLLAGTGAVLGQAWGESLVTPLVVLLKKLLYSRSKYNKDEVKLLSLLAATLGPFAFGMFLLCTLLIVIEGIGPLLMYGPTVNLYQEAGSIASLPHGTVQQGTFSSPALGGRWRTYWIYLPPSYATETTRRYPTLYLLHGSPGSPADWFVAGHAATTADVLIAEKKINDIILVSADGNGPVHRFSEWANSFDGRQRMEAAIAHDLVTFIDSHYRTLASANERAIGGLSMGGYGAMNIAMHHPEVFRKVISLGGYFQATGPVFGSGPASIAYRQWNSPAFLLHTAQGKQLLIHDFIVIGAGTTDKRYYRDAIAFYKELLAMKIPTRLLATTGGHAWPLWSLQLREALPLLQF